MSNPEFDRELFQTLASAPREKIILVGTRAALRSLPWLLAGDPPDRAPETTLKTARCLIIALVSARFPSTDFSREAEQAFNARAKFLKNTGIAADPTNFAIHSVRTDRENRSAAAVNAVMQSIGVPGDLFGGVDQANDAMDRLRSIANIDANVPLAELLEAPIWGRRRLPHWLSAWRHRDNIAFPSRPEWGFWERWYEAILTGQNHKWELWRQVAQIPGAEWDAGPERIAKIIAGFESDAEARQLSQALPLAETIEFDNAAQKFRAIPIEIAKPDLLDATLTQVEDALEDTLANQSNGLTERSRETRALRRVFEKYREDPQQVEMNLTTVSIGLRRQMDNENGDLPRSEENLHLVGVVEEAAIGVRATHPEVAENREILARQRFDDLSQDQRNAVREAAPDLVEISVDQMAEDFAEDAAMIAEDVFGEILPNYTASASFIRFFSRVAKIKIELDKMIASGRGFLDSPPGTLLQLASIADWLVKIGRWLLGIV